MVEQLRHNLAWTGADRQRSASEEKPSSSSKASNPNHAIGSLEEMPRISPRLEAGEKTENAEPSDRKKQNTNDNMPEFSHSFITDTHRTRPE